MLRLYKKLNLTYLHEMHSCIVQSRPTYEDYSKATRNKTNYM